MATYNSSVSYYRINANNTNIAVTNDGVGSTAPTEELTAPLSGGTYASGIGTSTINGQALSDFTAFAIGQYLYAINSNGDYVLLGQIATIDPGGLILTLTGNSLVPSSPSVVAGNVLAASYSLVTTAESIYIRVATQTTGLAQPNTANIPLMTSWRNSNSASATNRTAVTKLEQISNVGSPVSNGTVTNIPFTLQVMNVFTASGNGRCWNSASEFPAYIWIRAVLSPSGANLAGQTMFRWTTQETIDALVVTPNFSQQTLFNSGYVNINVNVIGTQTGPNNPVGA